MLYYDETSIAQRTTRLLKRSVQVEVVGNVHGDDKQHENFIHKSRSAHRLFWAGRTMLLRPDAFLQNPSGQVSDLSTKREKGEKREISLTKGKMWSNTSKH